MARVKKGAGNKHASRTAHPDCHRRNSFGSGEAKGSPLSCTIRARLLDGHDSTYSSTWEVEAGGSVGKGHCPVT